MAIDDLKGQIGRLPEQPGVYLFLNTGGDTIYVGKARVLRDRVRSYLGARGTSPRIDALLREAAGLETILTDSVVEALALENQLIKQRNPRFNILLRDDKTYPYLQLTMTERAPRVLVARRVERDGNVYAGPFMPAALARRTMALTHRLFGMRSCNEVIDGKRDRPCLEYDIKRCLAPCVDTICSMDEYRRAAEQARLLLEGRQSELIDDLRGAMMAAAGDEQFERAAHLRDAVRTIETLRDRQQKIETPSLGDRDAFGVKTGPSGAVVLVFQVRRGRVVDRLELTTDDGAPAGLSQTGSDPFSTESPKRGLTPLVEIRPDPELLSAALQQFYADREPPPDVYVPFELRDDERAALEAWLNGRAGRAVAIITPKRGEKRALVDLVARNAAVAYHARFGDGLGASTEALEELRVVLGLAARPRRIECFDISTLQGAETVASMVVCLDGRMRPSDYRKFKIRGLAPTSALPQPDDFAAMHEAVQRWYRRLLEHGGPFPDLIVIDGGKGQLTAAYQALRDVGLERLVAVGLAKREELIFTRDRADGIALAADSAGLRLMQRIRDEAHRFAVTFHRRSRTRRDLRSTLDDVRGIGPRRRRDLLRRFGSVAGVRRASREDLAAVVGAKAAEAVLKHFG